MVNLLQYWKLQCYCQPDDFCSSNCLFLCCCSTILPLLWPLCHDALIADAEMAQPYPTTMLLPSATLWHCIATCAVTTSHCCCTYSLQPCHIESYFPHYQFFITFIVNMLAILRHNNTACFAIYSTFNWHWWWQQQQEIVTTVAEVRDQVVIEATSACWKQHSQQVVTGSNTTAEPKMNFWYFDDKPVVKRGGITIYNNTATQQHNGKIYNYLKATISKHISSISGDQNNNSNWQYQKWHQSTDSSKKGNITATATGGTMMVTIMAQGPQQHYKNNQSATVN